MDAIGNTGGMMKRREPIIDVAKGISMLLIVFFHCDIWHGFLFQFHVPVFAFLSGYVFNSTKYCSNGVVGLVKCVKNKIKSLYVPFVGFNIFYVLLHNAFLEMNFYIPERGGGHYSTKEFVSKIVQVIGIGFNEGLLTPLWFLPCLMIAIILYAVISLCLSKVAGRRLITLIITFVLSVVGYNVNLPRNINLALILMFWFNVGNCCKELGILNYLQQRMETYRGKVLACCIFIGAVGVIMISMNLREDWSDIRFYVPLGYFAIWSGVIVVMQLSWIIIKAGKLLPVFLAMVGQHTIAILALHITVFRFVDTMQVVLYDLPEMSIGLGNMYHNGAWIVLYPILGILIPLMLSIGVRKIIKSQRKCKTL